MKNIQCQKRTPFSKQHILNISNWAIFIGRNVKTDKTKKKLKKAKKTKNQKKNKQTRKTKPKKPQTKQKKIQQQQKINPIACYINLF